MLKAPCKDCPDRHVLCHADCDKYQDFRRKKTEINEIKHQADMKEAEYWDYVKHSLKGRKR